MSKRCAYCDSNNLRPLLGVKKIPFSSQVLYRRKIDAILSPTKDLDVLLCNNCGLIFNASDFSNKMSLPEAYNNEDYFFSVSCSLQAKSYQKLLAKKINLLWNLKNKDVCEIGCGDGFFLSEIAKYCRKAVGFEPSSSYFLASKYKNTFIHNRAFCPDKNSSIKKKFNLFILRHVLEHIRNPFYYLKSLLNYYYKDKNKQSLFLEVPNANHLLKENLYFDFYSDHTYYFTEFFLHNYLKKIGWKNILSIDNKHKEFIKFFCCNDDLKADWTDEKSYLDAGISFSKNYLKWKNILRGKLYDIKKKGGKIGVWGAGSRGVTLLVSLGVEKDFFSYVIDYDKNKQNRFIPLLGTSIVNANMLQKEPVDYLLITSYTYFNEIANNLKKYRTKGLKIINPYPDIKIV